MVIIYAKFSQEQARAAAPMYVASKPMAPSGVAGSLPLKPPSAQAFVSLSETSTAMVVTTSSLAQASAHLQRCGCMMQMEDSARNLFHPESQLLKEFVPCSPISTATANVKF